MFVSKKAQETSIQKTVRGPAEVEKIFDKYIRLTTEKVAKSLSDAQGRYELGHAYKDPKPSQNWKVIKQADSVLEETVEMWMKVGIKKVAITESGETVDRQPATALVGILQEWLDMLEGMKADPQSEAARGFHQVAIEQAKPKTAPKAEGMTGWVYDAETDTYVAN